MRFANVYASDVPCLPSRTALSTGSFGIRNGVVNHGGAAADLRPIGPRRSFISQRFLQYHLDVAATVLDLAGLAVPDRWDGQPIDLGGPGREHLVVSQGAWACQRGVRWGDHPYLRTWHDGYHGHWPDEMLFQRHYPERLRATGRSHWADILTDRHPTEI